MTSLNTIKNWFRTGLRPTQDQFWATWDSFWHKEDTIPMQSITGLSELIAGKADADMLNNHITDTHAHHALLDTKVDKEDGKGLSEEDFTTHYKDKLEALGGNVETPTLDAVLTAGNSSKKSISLESSVGNPQSVKIDATGIKVASNFLQTNFDIDYKGDEILFKHTSRYSDRSTKYLCLKLKEGGTDNNPIYTQHFQDKSGTIALLEDIPTANSEPMPKKAIFNITFEIDPEGNKTYHHDLLYNNAGELVLQGDFIADPENENNIRLLLSLQFPEVYAKAVCMQENINLTYTMTTPDSKYFSSLSFVLEKSDKGILELVMPTFLFASRELIKLTFNAEFLLVE